MFDHRTEFASKVMSLVSKQIDITLCLYTTWKTYPERVSRNLKRQVPPGIREHDQRLSPDEVAVADRK